MNEKVYTNIKKRILNLHYAPGHNLNLKQLAKEFGVSQTPIREALMRLEWEKLVVILPRMGIHVAKIDFQELKEVYLSRVLIEGELGRLAAKNITEDHLLNMKNLHATCKRLKGDKTKENLVELDYQFRNVIFDAASCSTLQEIAELLYNQTLRVWYLTFDETDISSEVKMEAQEIEDTINAFSKHDFSIAKDLRREIIMRWIERLHKYYTRL